MIEKIRYYVSVETDPYVNLAIEKCLLDTVDDTTCILYLWQNTHTVVIGRNQNPWAECRLALLQQDGGVVARRLSGGGAVYHDLGNLNFTFLCAESNMDIARNMQIIQKACALAGITAEISGRNDITANGKKFSGNAFYYAKGKSYHHGTLLINADKEKVSQYLTPPKAKLQSKGVKSVGARVINLSELSPALTCKGMQDNLLQAFSEMFALPVERVESVDMHTVDVLASAYGEWDYIYGKTVDFSVSLEERFDWGNVQLLLQVEDGMIANVHTYTDAMDSNLPATIARALIGCRYDLPAVTQHLAAVCSGNVFTDLLSLFEKQGF